VVVHDVVDGGGAIFGIGRQLDGLFRAAIAVAAVIVHHALAHGHVGGLLVGGIDGGVDVEALGVGVFLVLGVHHLAHHFIHVFGMHRVLAARGTHLQFFLGGLVVLRLGDEAHVQHALQDVLLADVGALGVDDGVVGRGCLGQAGQHGGFGQGDVLEVLAEIGAGGGGEAEGALAQVDLVHVDLQDLVLGQGCSILLASSTS
jgi:hypothetical protein